MNWRRFIRALIEAVALAETVKPIQEAVRRSLSRYRLAGSGLDPRVSGITYNIYRSLGLVDAIIRGLAGLDPAGLDAYARAALRVVAYTHHLDEKMGPVARRTVRRLVAAELRRRGLDNLVGAVEAIASREWRPRGELEEAMLRYRVSPETYRALREALSLLGEPLDVFLRETLRPHPHVFRVNTLKASPDAILRHLRDIGVDAEPGRYTWRAIRINGGLRGEVVRFIETGVLVPQDESSIVAVELLSPRPGEPIADLCAAPGGKTTLLAEITRLRSRIYSFETSRKRGKRLHLLLERTGTGKAVTVYYMDARSAPEILGEESMAYVLLDPPCSSTGALARNPDVRWRYNPAEIREIAELQYELLEAGWRLLRPGGRLMYTVCSVLPWEGESHIKRFLEKHPDAKLVPLTKPFKQSPLLPGTMRAWPHVHRTIGFYYALLEKSL